VVVEISPKPGGTNDKYLDKVCSAVTLQFFLFISPILSFREWNQPFASIGAGVDSFYEYLLKSHILFGDEELYKMFNTVRTHDSLDTCMHCSPFFFLCHSFFLASPCSELSRCDAFHQ
jgi:hypothetical protein